MTRVMTADRDKIEKVVRIIAEGRAWGVEILPPDINESQIDFSVIYSTPLANGAPKNKKKTRIKDRLDPKIRFGLGAIRGVGESALEAILENGRRVKGETKISRSRRRIESVQLRPRRCRPLPATVAAIASRPSVTESVMI